MRIYTSAVILATLMLAIFAPVQISESISTPRGNFQAPSEGQLVASQEPFAYFQRDMYQTNTRDVVVLFFEFLDQERISESKIEEIKTETFPLVADYFEEASYGSVSMEFSFKGPKDAERNSSYYEGNLEDMAEDAVDIYDDQVDFSQYDHILIVSNGDWRNATASLGQHQIESEDGDLWMGVAQTSDFLWEPRVFPPPEATTAHELYHNIGGLPDLYTSPNEVDSWDPMAESGLVHTISYLKTGDWLDWLPQANIETLEPGTFENYTLHPLEYESESGLQALKIPTPDDHFYFVEVRRNTSISDGLPEEGVLITKIEEKDSSTRLRLDGQRTEVPEFVAKVMDAQPQSGTLDDASYQVYDQFRVEEDNLHIEVLSEDGSSYKVRAAFAMGTPELTIRAPVSQLSVVIDGEMYEMDENGVLSKNVWPGRTEIGLPSKVEINERKAWFFRKWGDGDSDNVRVVNVSSDMELNANYEMWKQVRVQFTNGFGFPLRNTSLSGIFDGENVPIRTDEEGQGTAMIPEGEQKIILNYFGQEKILELGHDDYKAKMEVPYTPFTTFVSGLAVAIFLLFLSAGVRRFAGNRGKES